MVSETEEQLLWYFLEIPNFFPNNHLARNGQCELNQKYTDAVLATTKSKGQSV